MIIGREPKKWLLLGALVLLTPIFSVAQHTDKQREGCSFREPRCRQVPDGGSAVSYLLAVGATCLGAMVVRSRFSKSRVS